MSKLILAWDKPTFTPEDEERLERMLADGAIDGIKCGHIAKEAEDDYGVSTESKIRSFMKDSGPNIGILYMRDAKLIDVGATAVEAVRIIVSQSRLGNRVDVLTIYADITHKGLRDVAKICRDAGTAALLVSALTDFGGREFARRFGKTPAQRVLEAAEIARDLGFHGVICSGRELDPLRKHGYMEDLLTGVPGIRPNGSSAHGQRRTITPKEAAAKGVTYAIVGTPILESPDWYNAALEIRNSMKQAKH